GPLPGLRRVPPPRRRARRDDHAAADRRRRSHGDARNPPAGAQRAARRAARTAGRRPVTLRTSLRRFALFVAASVALTWWIAGEITGRGPSGGIDLTARFGDVSGLVAGDDVRLGGLPVGRVQRVEVVDGEAVVDFTVDDDVDVPADSTIAVRWRNLIGQRYLALRPGDARARLADGDQVERVDDVVDLGRIVNQLSPLAQAVGPDQVNRI